MGAALGRGAGLRPLASAAVAEWPQGRWVGPRAAPDAHLCPQIPGARTRVWRGALRLPCQEGEADPQRGPEVLPADHLRAGLLSQPLYMVRVPTPAGCPQPRQGAPPFPTRDTLIPHLVPLPPGPPHSLQVPPPPQITPHQVPPPHPCVPPLRLEPAAHVLLTHPLRERLEASARCPPQAPGAPPQASRGSWGQAPLDWGSQVGPGAEH